MITKHDFWSKPRFLKGGACSKGATALISSSHNLTYMSYKIFYVILLKSKLKNNKQRKKHCLLNFNLLSNEKVK